MRKVSTALALSLLALPLVAGCASSAELQPAATATAVDDTTAVDRVAGVRVRVDGAPGLALPEGTENAVTPVRVVIENQGDDPLRIRLRELRLLERDGAENVALPPLQLDAEVPGAVSPAFGASRFSLAPRYAPFYAGGVPRRGLTTGPFTSWSGPFDADPYYSPTYYPRWVNPLPTTEMVSRALPEGVLSPGGSVDGLVFFEGISPLEDRVLFVADLVNARTGAVMGTIRIPFEVRAVSAVARR